MATSLRTKPYPGSLCNYHVKRGRVWGGFTLMELLVVMAIIAILAAVAIPSLAGLKTAGGFNSTVNNLDETLNLARQTAVSRNTYVWVAFSVPGTSNNTFATLVVASADGTNPTATSSWNATVELSSTNSSYYIVAKPTIYPQCQFIDAGTLTSANIPSLSNQPSASASANGLSTTLNFQAALATGTQLYSRVLEFNPSGQAYNGPNPEPFIEFGVYPAPSSTIAYGQNVALMRIPFITGMTQLYRP